MFSQESGYNLQKNGISTLIFDSRKQSLIKNNFCIKFKSISKE